MRQDILELGPQGRVEIRGLVDSDDIDRLNADDRIILGLGFTLLRSMRKIANIDADELSALCLQGDIDALEYTVYSNPKALKRLLIRFPAWRCSEGAV
jgi:hypothetical protein